MKNYQDDLVGKTFFFFFVFRSCGISRKANSLREQLKMKKKDEKISESDLMRSDKSTKRFYRHTVKKKKKKKNEVLQKLLTLF
jgi:hypothetical protein